jgi:putative peptide zinc metalloprotease protein
VSEYPRLRPDLVLVEQTYRGEQSFIVKDPTAGKYFRFRPLEIAVMRSLDGRRTPAEAAAELVERGIKVSAVAVSRFAEKLKTMGLCERTLRESSVLLMERLRAQRRKRLRPGMFQGDILRLRWSVGDPDRLMDRTMPYLRFFFTRGFLTVSVALFVIYLVILGLKWSEFAAAMATVYLLRASLGDYVLLWAVTMVIVAVHELAHGYTCKYFGGKVHEIGAMLFYFELAFFCNVNDAWTFPERRARLWVTAAGSWIEMVVAGIAAIIWWLAAPGTAASDVALAFVMVGGLAAVLVNLNPLIPLDGYYALSDWLEVPNLRQRAFGHVAWLLRTRVLGQDLPMPPADEREQRIFLLYGTRRGRDRGAGAGAVAGDPTGTPGFEAHGRRRLARAAGQMGAGDESAAIPPACHRPSAPGRRGRVPSLADQRRRGIRRRPGQHLAGNRPRQRSGLRGVGDRRREGPRRRPAGTGPQSRAGERGGGAGTRSGLPRRA